MFGALLEVAMWKKCMLLWRDAEFEVQACKTLQLRGTFGHCDVQKVHAGVAGSTLRSENANTALSDHIWTLNCSKSAPGLWRVKNTPFSEHFWKFSC